MFSTYHFIWCFICLCLIIGCLILLHKYKPELNKVLNIACICCIASELIKTLSVIKIVPSSDGTAFFPYIEMQHMPLHLCSLQILVIFYVRFTKNTKMRQIFLGFMYPTCTLGAFFAMLLPSIFSSNSVVPSEAFIRPLAYQYFLYHSMLIILGLYIATCKEAELKWKNYFSTVAILFVIAFISLYLNSALATPTYINEQLVSVDYIPNFFFTYLAPIDIDFTKIGHWYIYISVIVALAILLIGAFYLPFYIKERRIKKK